MRVECDCPDGIGFAVADPSMRCNHVSRSFFITAKFGELEAVDIKQSHTANAARSSVDRNASGFYRHIYEGLSSKGRKKCVLLAFKQQG